MYINIGTYVKILEHVMIKLEKKKCQNFVSTMTFRLP